MALKDKFIVRLTAEQRRELEGLAATGQRSAAVITRARVLLKADAEADGWTDDRIAEALDASWLNRAELELSVLARQCLNRRLPDQETLAREVAAWEAGRNAAAVTVDWQFTTADARVKLKRLYPSIEPQ